MCRAAKWDATEEVVLSRRRCARGIDTLQCGYELSQVGCRLSLVSEAVLLGRAGLSFFEGCRKDVYTPWNGVTISRKQGRSPVEGSGAVHRMGPRKRVHLLLDSESDSAVRLLQ